MIEVTRYPMLMSVVLILWWGPQSMDFVIITQFHGLWAYVLKVGYDFHSCLQSASLERVQSCTSGTYLQQAALGCLFHNEVVNTLSKCC